MPKRKSSSIPTPIDCWVLQADGVPVGVFTNKRNAIIERLRLSKAQQETHLIGRLLFTLSDPVTLILD